MSFGALLLALHALGATVWVGGLFFALAVLRPGMAFLEAAHRLALHEQVLGRFFLVIWYAMPVMLVTGFAMELLFYGGVSTTPWPLLVMTGSGLVMAAIFVAIVQGPWRDLRRALAKHDASRAGEALRRIRGLLSLNLALGVFTTIVAMLDS